MALGVMAAAGCNEKEPQKDPTPEPTPAIQSFEISVDAVTKKTVTYSVTPEILDKEYIAVVTTAESLAGLEDEAVVEHVYDEIKAAAASAGLTFAEKMSAIAAKGASQGVVVDGLAVNTEYAVVVFGVDPANNWESTTFPELKEFKTAAVEAVSCTFDVAATVEQNNVSLAVTPSDNNIKWHLLIVTKAMYDTYTDAEGDYKWTKDVFYQAYAENEINEYLGAGYTEDQVIEALFFQGPQTLKAEGLNAATEYLYLVAGFDMNEGLYVVTEVTDGSFVTEEPASSGLTFDISVTDIEQMRAAILITPSDLTEKFCWMVQPYDGTSSAEEVMNGIVAANKMWFDMGFMLYTGVQDYTGGPDSPYKFKLDTPDTEYCVIAFGYAGGVTSEPVMVTFRTLPGDDPADCTFTYEVTEESTYGLSFYVTPSDPSVYYYGDVCVDGTYDEAARIAEVEAGIESMVAMQQMFDPSATVTSVIGMYYWNGPNYMDAKELAPDTSYTLFLYALDAKTGKVAAAHSYPSFAKTKPVGTIVPEIEIVGYYSGDEEAGAVFGQPEVTAGKCIAVVKYNVDPSATALYAGILEGNGMDATEYPDDSIHSYLNGYWNQISMAQPYSFYVLNWAVEQTAFAYALDANGGEGALARSLVLPTAEEKGNIEDLKSLVEELNSATRTTVSTMSVEAMPAASSEPVVSVREKVTADNAVPSQPALPSFGRSIKAGYLMQLDHVPAIWTI